MTDKPEILDRVRHALASEPRIGPHAAPIAMDYAAGTLTLEGEVANIAAKKLVLEHAAAIAGVTGIVDRLRVAPAECMGDRQITDLVRDALLQEPALAETALIEVVKGEDRPVREPAERHRGWIRMSVADGVVTLDGEAPSLAHKRLAGVLAWWVPGSRDVINGLGVEPVEVDSDDEIADAVRLVLEKDPFVDAGQVRVGARNAVVRLAGLVPTDSERDMAEFDAWYVFGVDRVENRLEVHPVPATGGVSS
jgi:osmotically-inducible protein OsmY